MEDRRQDRSFVEIAPAIRASERTCRKWWGRRYGRPGGPVVDPEGLADRNAGAPRRGDRRFMGCV
jgi:hypothetical protein